MELIKFSQFNKMPWKNGQGTTYEVIIDPPGSSVSSLNFNFRISMALVQQENNFSDFSGYYRFLTIIEGEGITFNLTELKKFEVIKFDGSESVLSKPLGSEPVLDLGCIFKNKEDVDFFITEQIVNKVGHNLFIFPLEKGFPFGNDFADKFDCLIINDKDRDAAFTISNLPIQKYAVISILKTI